MRRSARKGSSERPYQISPYFAIPLHRPADKSGMTQGRAIRAGLQTMSLDTWCESEYIRGKAAAEGSRLCAALPRPSPVSPPSSFHHPDAVSTVRHFLLLIAGAGLSALALEGHLSQIAAQADDDPVALFQAARFKEARSAFQRRLAGSPDDPEALYYLGQLVSEAAQSRRFLERLIRLHPEHRLAQDAAFDLAEADFADPAGRYLSARRRYRAFVQAHPESRLVPDALYRIGLTYLVVHEPDSAALAFEEAVERFPESDVAPHARLGRIQAHVQKGEARAALRAAQVLLTDGAGPVEAVVRALTIDLEKGRPSAPGEDSGNPPEPEEGRFWVQVGAFRGLANLQALSARLVKAGLRVSVEERGDLKVLFVGPYSDRRKAEEAEAQIEREEGLRCTVKERKATGNAD